MKQDKTLTCTDCGKQFTFTADEQTHFQERGYDDPKRCPSCRAAKKAARESGGRGGR